MKMTSITDYVETPQTVKRAEEYSLYQWLFFGFTFPIVFF